MTRVSVHGLGYIGLPTAMLFANDGVEVVGRDIDEEVIANLKRGSVDIHDPELELFINNGLDSGNFSCSQKVTPSEHHLICVPTPFTAAHEPAQSGDAGEVDLTAVKAATRSIAPHLRPDDTVILESTVPPGTTEQVIEPLLAARSNVGDEVKLAYSPETVMPGNIVQELRTNNRIVGGTTEKSATAAARLYDPHINGEIHRVSDATTAEFVKLAQNAYRDANIAIANELAKIARDYGIDAHDAIEVANRHPRVNILRPGPGVGGHCLPVDPLFLGHESDSLSLLLEARRVNDGMAEYVTGLVERSLDETEDITIAILGIAYKGNVDDVRNSPGLRVAEQLREKVGADVRLHDPVVRSREASLVDLDRALADADAMVITADHDEFEELDPDEIGRQTNGDLIVDPMNVINGEKWRVQGFTVEQI